MLKLNINNKNKFEYEYYFRIKEGMELVNDLFLVKEYKYNFINKKFVKSKYFNLIFSPWSFDAKLEYSKKELPIENFLKKQKNSFYNIIELSSKDEWFRGRRFNAFDISIHEAACYPVMQESIVYDDDLNFIIFNTDDYHILIGKKKFFRKTNIDVKQTLEIFKKDAIESIDDTFYHHLIKAYDYYKEFFDKYDIK